MLKLKFNLRHQDIQLVNKGVVVATDSKDYLVAKFNTVSDDWEAPLTAIFTDDKHKQPYAIIVGADERLAEDECFVPWEVLTDAANVYVSVYCGNLHTTVTAAFKVRKSGYIEGETPPPPSPTVYDIIMQAITDLQVGKQDKLTAGENITIDENGEISATGGVTINQTVPQIISGSQYPYEVGDLFLYNQKIYRFRETHTVHLIGELNLFDKIGRRIVFSYSNPPQSETTRAVSTYDSGDLFVIRDRQAANSQGRLIGQDVYLCVDVLYTGTSDNKMHYAYTWQKIRVEDISKIISSAAVNQNGTITFTMSDGSTVTTTGESVTYTLTEQDKQDIADIVLQRLQGGG